MRNGGVTHYLNYTWKKKLILLGLMALTAVLALYAISAGSAELSPLQVLLTLIGQTEGSLRLLSGQSAYLECWQRWSPE